MYSIEDILLQKAQQDEEFRAGAGSAAVGIGATLGALAGATAIQGPKLDTDDLGQRIMGTGKGIRNRMAGGLVGAIVGGALGKGMQEAAIKESPAAALLAKMQVQGSLNTAEKYQLEKMIKDSYNNQLGLA